MDRPSAPAGGSPRKRPPLAHPLLAARQGCWRAPAGDFHAAGDTELAAWSEFLRKWWVEKSDHPIGVSDLYFLALQADPPLELGDAGDHGRKSRLGRMLVAKRDRPVLLELEGGGHDRVCVRQAGVGRGQARGTHLWRLVAMDA